MPHPFSPGLKDLEETSYKLKIIATIWETTMTDAIRQIVDEYYEAFPEEEIEDAIIDVGPMRIRTKINPNLTRMREQINELLEEHGLDAVEYFEQLIYD